MACPDNQHRRRLTAPFREHENVSLVAPEIKFERWVNDNNPDHSLSYGKGWWDTIEFFFFLKEELQIEDMNVVATFTLRTPPPTEELLSPIVRLRTDDFVAYLKEDFGEPLIWWTMSLKVHRDIKQLDLSPFLIQGEAKNRALEGFSPNWLNGPYEPGSQAFTSRLANNYDIYGVLRQISRSPRWWEGE